MPSSSSWLANWMLAASSKRAFSSTTTATCLPLRAAVLRKPRMFDFRDVR
jgi:hypothetical protein